MMKYLGGLRFIKSRNNKWFKNKNAYRKIKQMWQNVKKLVNLAGGCMSVHCNIFANHLFCRVANFKIKSPENEKISLTREVLIKHIYDKRLLSKIYKNPLKLNKKKTQIKNWAKT